MGSNFGDLDNDGFPRLLSRDRFAFLWRAGAEPAVSQPTAVRRFDDVTASTGTGHLQKGHGIAFGDVDGDGDQDIFLHTGGACQVTLTATCCSVIPAPAITGSA